MDERDFLTLARRLIAETAEASWRTAVGRAYYAAFHVARRLLEGLNFTVPQAERAHSYLCLRLSNCGDPQVQDAGADLNTLRRGRNAAGYDLRRPMRQLPAQAYVDMAEQVIQALDAASADPARRTQVMNEMARYERDVLHDVPWRP